MTGDPAADRLVNTEPLAVLLAMLLDQQVPMDWAFRGPAKLRERLGHLDVDRIAAMDPEQVVAVFCAKPALHRFPAAMARRTHELCTHIVERFGGDPAAVWSGVDSGAELLERLDALPGYGAEKAQIFLAILAKRMGVAPQGWREAAGKFGEETPRSVADVHDAASLARVREWKRAQKAAKKDKQDRPLP